MTQSHRLSYILLSFLTRFEALVVAPDAYGVRLGLFPRGVDARNVPQPDTVEYFWFLDRPGGERFVLALEGPKSDRVRSGTLLDGFDLSLIHISEPTRPY